MTSSGKISSAAAPTEADSLPTRLRPSESGAAAALSLRFAARFGYTIEPETFAAIQKLAAGIDQISRERLFPGIASEHVWRGLPTFFPEEAGSLAQRRGYRGRGSGRNDVARASILLGAVAAITGTAVLVYSNRPECSVNARESGCGYGTKVAGSAVLSAGLVGLLVGALTWR